VSVLFLEPIGGIAGDMFLAASIDLGLSPDDVGLALKAVDLGGYRLSVSRATRHAISGTHLDVLVDGPVPHERAYQGIQALIARSTLRPATRDRAASVFERLAIAESRVHGTTIDEVHFHEVGAVDSIVDIVGAAVAVELLGEPRLFAASPPMGSGMTQSAHGVIPVPGPATVELLKDRPVRYEGSGEMTTPTGAAILAALTEPGAPPEFVPRKVGYGVGSRNMADRPNVLRATLGELVANASRMLAVETNLDDMNPQLFGHLFEMLLGAGAVDVSVGPLTMKKGRPGHRLEVLCTVDARDAITRVLFRETTTIGVRYHGVDRLVLDRVHRSVETPYGAIRMKVSSLLGETMNASPEYDDCLACAKASGVPVKTVITAALAAYEAARAREGGR
jgi:pyridinium-3,5-bisthiocarboxylic acid mononucleotide nickel chelatase